MVNVKVCFVELFIGGAMVFYHYDRLSALSPGQKVELSRDYCKLGSQAEGVPVVLSEMFPEGLSMHGYHYLDVFVSESLIGVACLLYTSRCV